MGVRLLCLGDVVGTPGRNALTLALPVITSEKQIDCSIVNVENASAGSGLTPDLYEKFIKAGVHLMTLGDHVYRRKQIIPVLEQSERICRPANLSSVAPGRDYATFELDGGVKVAVFTIMGQMFMKPSVDCPFAAADRVIASIPKDVKIVVAEIHAETTAEKVALGWHLDGRVSVVFGTHTHVPTADEAVLPGGTAYITDLGMTGPYDSVLGRNKVAVVSAMSTRVPQPFDIASGDRRACGIVVDVDAGTGRATAVERIRADVDHERRSVTLRSGRTV